MTDEQRKQFFAIRKTLDSFVVKIAESTSEINENISVIRKWTPGIYAIGDVRLYKDVPYKCIQAHDSTANIDWTPAVASLWMQYHGTSKETARPWVAPAGAHDMYKVGEWMIWTDGVAYKCLVDTVYSPAAYSSAWEK